MLQMQIKWTSVSVVLAQAISSYRRNSFDEKPYVIAPGYIADKKQVIGGPFSQKRSISNEGLVDSGIRHWSTSGHRSSHDHSACGD